MGCRLLKETCLQAPWHVPGGLPRALAAHNAPAAGSDVRNAVQGFRLSFAQFIAARQGCPGGSTCNNRKLLLKPTRIKLLG